MPILRDTGGLMLLCLMQAAGCSTVLGIDKDYTDLRATMGNGGGASSGAGSPDGLGGSPDGLGGSPDGFGGSLDGLAGSSDSPGGSPDGLGGSPAGAGTGGSPAGGGGSGGSAASAGLPNASGGSTAGSGSASCAGALSNGVCWYLGALGQSCTAVCSRHSGNAPTAASFVGVVAQGGSLAKCTALLTLLGNNNGAPGQATRSDGMGVGCHNFGAKNYWLTSPTYSPTAAVGSARVVCGCQE